MEKQKFNYRPILFTLSLVLVAVALLIYFTEDGSEKATPIIRLSYFNDNTEFATSIEKTLHTEIGKQKYFWIGYEPENEVHIDLTKLLKHEIEKQHGAFDIVIVDKELMLVEEKEKAFGMTHEIPLKEDFAGAAELIKANADKKILVITAAIYSSNFIKENPHAKVQALTTLKPMAFSMGFFPVAVTEERNTIFKCDTEDKTGTAPWACGVINKSRAIRRKIDLTKLQQTPPLRIGLMDLTGDTDYMVLVGK